MFALLQQFIFMLLIGFVFSGCNDWIEDNTNHAPTISGVPQTQLYAYDNYVFTPTSSDKDNDKLSYSIKNKPSWATFDISSGFLIGIPNVEQVNETIEISVSDGKLTTSLASFSITVKPAKNIAHEYGIAKQGSTYGSSLASYAIDNNMATWNHTKCNNTGNWWEVKLPIATKIAKVVIHNRSGQTARLSGTKLYLGTEEYTDVFNEANHEETLTSSSEKQVFEYSTSKDANILLLKANGSNCLHTPEVEIYGTLPFEPVFLNHKTELLIKADSALDDVVIAVPAIDYQETVLSYGVNHTAFKIDSSGTIRVNGILDQSSYPLEISVTDGTYVTRTNIVVLVSSTTAVEEALISGDVRFVTSEELLDEAIAEVTKLSDGNSLLELIYENSAITYDPGNRTQLIKVIGDAHKIFPILQGNKNNTLAAAGEKNNSRFAAFGASPTESFEDDKNLDFELPFKRLLAWLIQGEALDMTALDTTKSVTLAFTKSDTNNIKSWITQNYPNWNISECHETATFSTCATDSDLLIFGWQTENQYASEVQTILETQTGLGTPVLYLHTWYEAYNDVAHTIADYFSFELPYGGNYWAKDAASWTDVEQMKMELSKEYESIATLLKHLKNSSFSVDWSQCDDSGSGDQCEYTNIFGTSANLIRSKVTTLDKNKTVLFPNDDYRLEKLLILVGDKFREEVKYPMDKNTTDDNEFFRSLFADYTVYNYRIINVVQNDMGNFSRSDFSHITPTNKTVTRTSKQKFRSAGVYALPGQTFKVTRTDNSDVTTKVFVNSLRSGATHEFETNGYKRPKFLQTQWYELKPNEPLSLTSTYGGPIHISFDTNDLECTFTFENIGEHAYWEGSSDDVAFAEKLEANEYDWAEVVTSGFEVHSKTEKMVESVNDSKWQTAAVLANATKQYMSNYPHVLAGFQGPGIDVVSEIHDFATTNNLTIETLDMVKHMNADQATCGYGCSGNPYDAYWAFSPVGHGDVHELGHGLEKSRFRFEGFETHSTTNPYSYYTKSQYAKESGNEPECQNLPFESVFTVLQESALEADSIAYLKTNLWDSSGWSQQFMVTLQAMMHAQKENKLENGWHLLSRLHILEREVSRVKKDWENLKSSIGFTTYSLDEFNSMGKNDWLLISLSYAVELDFRDYLTMMGIEYSTKASAQVESFGYNMVPKEFFVSTSNGYCKTDTYGNYLDKTPVVIDGTEPWPTNP